MSVSNREHCLKMAPSLPPAENNGVPGSGENRSAGRERDMEEEVSWYGLSETTPSPSGHSGYQSDCHLPTTGLSATLLQCASVKGRCLATHFNTADGFTDSQFLEHSSTTGQ